MATKKKPEPLTAQLREAVRASGLKQEQLAQATGIPQPTISKFMCGRAANGETIDKIAAALGKSLN